MSEVTPESVRAALQPITDPEIAVSIVELGLIRNIEVDAGGARVKVTMTLTTPFCPEGPEIVAAVDHTLRSIPGVLEASVELQWTPAWDPRTEASDDVKAMLGIWD